MVSHNPSLNLTKYFCEHEIGQSKRHQALLVGTMLQVKCQLKLTNGFAKFFFVHETVECAIVDPKDRP